MFIKWIEDVELEIVESCEDEEPKSYKEMIEVERIHEIDIFGVGINNEKEHIVDMQFGDGSVACGVQRKWYEEIDEPKS